MPVPNDYWEEPGMIIVRVMTVVLVVALMSVTACKKSHPRVVPVKDTVEKSTAVVKIKIQGVVKNEEKSRYWVNIVKAGSPESEWGSWIWVSDGTTELDIPMPRDVVEGAYEVRLHSDYPVKTFNVIDRKPVTIK